MLTPTQLRAAAARARRERQPVRLLPAEVDALAGEIERPLGVLDNERHDSAFWKARAQKAEAALAAAHDAIRHAGASAITCSCDACATAVCTAIEG